MPTRLLITNIAGKIMNKRKDLATADSNGHNNATTALVLEGGQSPENTKISDRAHALHITKEAWSNITQHQHRNKRIQNAIDGEQAHREALKHGSEAMTKEWPNSLQNIRLRKEEERRNRFTHRMKEDKVALFYKMRAEQEAERKKYIDKVKKEMYITRGYPKELTSALVLSEILYEREKQKEFRNDLKKREEEIQKEFEAQISASDAKQKEEDLENQRKRREAGRKVGEILLKQIKENEQSKKSEVREHIEKETLDRLKAAEEEELIKQYQIEEKLKRQRENARERKKAILEDHKRKQILAKENEEMEKATEFYSQARERMDCLKKVKDKQMREEGNESREILAAKIAAMQASQNDDDDARLAKLVAEKEAEEKAKAEARKAFEEQAVRDRLQDRKKYMEKLERDKKINDEMKKWEMLNRLKTSEVMKEYDEQNRRAKWAKILEYRKDLLEQMASDKAEQKREKEIDEIISRVSFEEADRMFFEYADEVLELAKSKNRSTYPIEKVIAEYKSVHKLEDKQRPQCSK